MPKCLTLLVSLLVAGASCSTRGADHVYGTITGWGQVVDPDGDCVFHLMRDGLTIEVGAEPHGMEAASRVNAPRVVQSIGSDFSVEVAVDGNLPLPETAETSNSAYVSGGLLIMQDTDNYIRLERASFSRSGVENFYANFEMWKDGRSVRMGRFADFPLQEDRIVTLRLEAKGNTVRALVRHDDEGWHEMGTAQIDRSSASLVGTHAINTTRQVVKVHFSQFELDRSYQPVEAEGSSGIDLSAPAAIAMPNTSDPGFAKFMVTMRQLQQRSTQLRTMEPSERDALLAEAVTAVKDAPRGLSTLSLSIARGLSQSFEVANDYERAVDVYREFADALEPTAGQAMADQLRKMADELSEKLALIGKPLELEGKLLDGTTLQWDDYHGSVVLVDFWASWCGPCRREIPNVLEQYARFKDQGFRVLGVCLDTDREKAEEYIADAEMPWPSLFEEDAGWSHPMATRYNVRAIPTAMLVDRDGNVVSLSARGETLQSLLEEMFTSTEVPATN